MWKLKSLTRSDRKGKKYKAVFVSSEGKTKTTHFGAVGYEDFTMHKDEWRKEKYIKRHDRGREDWNDPTTAGALSRWLLWNKPTLKASLADFKKRFGV
jgi:hypothetical protein